MTSAGRMFVVLTILLVAGMLATATIIVDHSNTTGAVAGFTGLAGTILGYVFGDRNGEKRLAAAIVTTAADSSETDAVHTARDIVTPGATPPGGTVKVAP